MKRATEILQTMTAVAVMLVAVGGGLMFKAWPDTELVREATTSPVTGEEMPARYEDSGSVGLTAVGGALAWTGQSLLLVSLVGWGTMLGRRAAGPVLVD